MIFGSLRNRILLFFSLLTVSVQLVSYWLVSETNGELAAENRASREQLIEHSMDQAVEAAYAGLDRELYFLSSNLNIRAAENKPALLKKVLVSRLGQLNQSGLAAGHSPDRLLLLHDVDGKLHFASDPNFEIETLRFASEHVASGGLMHSGFIVDRAAQQQVYLSSTLPVQASQGEFWITAASDIRESILPAVERVSQSHVQITLNSEQPGERGSGIVAVPVKSMPIVSVVSISGAGDSFTHLIFNQNTKLKLLLAASLLVLLAVGYALADELTKPLILLTLAAKKIKEGDYSEPIKIRQKDEIGQLAASINHMRQRVAHREDRILKLAYADPLTGLPNRALFDDRLNRAVSTGNRIDSPFSVFILDMDRFKYINDVLGHEAGDSVLKEVAERLKGTLRDSDTVARLGGDEFALLLLTDSDADILAAVKKVIAVFEQPVSLNNQPIDVGCSIGIAKFPEHGNDASLLLRRADIAMYSAKRINENYAFYDPECDEHQQEHLSLLSDIKRAIEKDELQLYYQPKVTFEDESLLSVETLMRWQHPQRGLVPPEEFIPFAEQTGAIRLVTRWLIEHALKQAGDWHKKGLPIKMSLNISARDLLDPDFPDMVKEHLGINSVIPSMICMEITESALMEDPAKARRTVEQLHRMGLEMSIDDFGTGYSSLAYVKNLPVNELKIDRDFVKNMLENEEDIAIVRSTIELGHNLGLKVVAEGIEKEQELEVLKSFGCDQGQGFLISHALSAGDLEEWVHKNQNIPVDISSRTAS